jgi:hypothetical protein
MMLPLTLGRVRAAQVAGSRSRPGPTCWPSAWPRRSEAWPRRWGRRPT